MTVQQVFDRLPIVRMLLCMNRAFALALQRVAGLLVCRDKTEKSSRKEEADRKDEKEKVR